MRGDYLILSWHPQEERAVQTASRIETALLREPHIALTRANGLLIAAEHMRVEQPAPSIFLVGELFSNAPGTPLPRPRSACAQGFKEYCGELLGSHWGSYLALQHDPHASDPLWVFAEPIGSRECVHWHHGGITVLGCDAERWLARFAPADLGPDIGELAQIIHHPAQAAETAPLCGVRSLQPGAITQFGPSGTVSHRLWSPSDHCDPGGGGDDPAALARLVDASVAAWSSTCAKPILELSGGLDSAIVAAALRRTKGEGIDAFTFFSDSLAGDERRFSRPVAETLGLVSHELMFEIRAMDEAQLEGAAIGIRPGIGSTTFFHDRRLAEAGRVCGADMLFTGRGGDALFFQHPTPLIAQGGWPAGPQNGLRPMEALARWCQTSVWKVALASRLPMVAARATSPAPNRFCLQAGRARPSIWAGSVEGLPAGKRMQIEAIAGDRNAFGPSRCAQAMRVIHPLLSQPIVEYVLGRSLMTLTQGRRDRAMARDAFADRLPTALIERRGKGALSYFFGQTLARSAPLLRTRLLDGALAEAGLVDRPRLEQALDPEYLVQSNCYGEIIRLLTVERWLRGWKERLRPSVTPPPRKRVSRPSKSSLRMMFTTPATASDP